MHRLDGDDARNLAYHITRNAAEQLGMEGLLEWHSSALARCYLSPTTHFELVVNFSRGFDTSMRFSVDAHAEESVDRLTDRTIDVIKHAVKTYVNEYVDDMSVSEDEYVTRLSVSRFNGDGDDAGGFDHEYVAEFETETIHQTVVVDEEMSGNPHLAGRRLMVSDIWHRHILRDVPVEDLPSEFEGIMTVEEAREAIEYAKSNDSFKTAEELSEKQELSSSDFVRFEELLDEE